MATPKTPPGAEPSQGLDLSSLLLESITAAAATFEEGELAYLALTSKIERPFVDRLAYQLHRRLEDTGLIVAREHHICRGVRADLAVLEGGKVLAVLEAKATATADFLRENGLRREYSDLLQGDLLRYRSAENEHLQIFALLLATHLLTAPLHHHRHAVKYARLLGAAFKTGKAEEEVRLAAEQNLGRYLRPETRLASGKIAAGEALGVSVDVLWWLFGPFSVPAGLSILLPGDGPSGEAT